MDSPTVPPTTEAWLALIAGNTRLHWAYFQGDRLLSAWHTPYLERELALRLQSSGFDTNTWQRVPGLAYSADIEEPSAFQQMTACPVRTLWMASVVPKQTALWAHQRASDSEQSGQIPTYVAERSQIALDNIYPTLGIDRAINLLGAGHALGWPVLVIDAGTALTFTAGKDSAISGGAILPGLQLQAQALNQQTANLPLAGGWLIEQRAELPDRWAMTTPGAISSGLAYGTVSTIQDYLADWWQQCPTGKAVITGGDGSRLHLLLQQKTPEIASRVVVDSHLMFKGMARYRNGAMLLL